MDENNKKISQMILILSVVTLAISLLPLAPIATVKATATDTTVTRTLSTTNPTSGSTFEVMLSIAGHQTYVSGQKVLFAVVNETSIKYEVRAPSEGSGAFGVAETPSSPVSGFDPVLALAGLFVVAVRFLFRRKRRGGEGSE